MMKEIKFRFELNDKKNLAGLQEVFLIINDNGTRKKIKTEVYVKNDCFGVYKHIISSKGQKIYKRVLTPGNWIVKDEHSKQKNDKLQNKLNEYKRAYEHKKETDFFVTKEAVIKTVESKYVLKDVIGVFERYIKELNNADDYLNEKGYITTKRHLENYLKKKKLHSIDFRHIDKQFLIQFEKHLFGTIKKGECSDASVHTQLKRLRRIFNYAISEQIITPDIYPFKAYNLPVIKKKYKERLTIDEISLFEAEVFERGSLIFNVQQTFLLAIRLAGTRIEDILTLRVKNIKQGRITFNMKKGNTLGKLKSIKINVKIQSILNNYITVNSKPDDFIFNFLPIDIESWTKTEYKKEIERKTALINKYLKKIAKKTGIKKKITTHISRHSFASIALKATKDIKAVQDALGHSSPVITQRYLDELNIESQDEMMDEVSALMAF